MYSPLKPDFLQKKTQTLDGRRDYAHQFFDTFRSDFFIIHNHFEITNLCPAFRDSTVNWTWLVTKLSKGYQTIYQSVVYLRYQTRANLSKWFPLAVLPSSDFWNIFLFLGRVGSIQCTAARKTDSKEVCTVRGVPGPGDEVDPARYRLWKSDSESEIPGDGIRKPPSYHSIIFGWSLLRSFAEINSNTGDNFHAPRRVSAERTHWRAGVTLSSSGNHTQR